MYYKSHNKIINNMDTCITNLITRSLTTWIHVLQISIIILKKIVVTYKYINLNLKIYEISKKS